MISPCPTLYQRRNNMGDGLAAMKWYKEHSKTRHGAPTNEVAMENRDSEIIVGKFVDRQRPEFCESMRAWYAAKLGERYVEPCIAVPDDDGSGEDVCGSCDGGC